MTMLLLSDQPQDLVPPFSLAYLELTFGQSIIAVEL